jgi:hypothetical protein
MPKPTRKLVLIQLSCSSSLNPQGKPYKVKKAINTVEFNIGDYLSKKEVEHLIGRGINIEISRV